MLSVNSASLHKFNTQSTYLTSLLFIPEHWFKFKQSSSSFHFYLKLLYLLALLHVFILLSFLLAQFVAFSPRATESHIRGASVVACNQPAEMSSSKSRPFMCTWSRPVFPLTFVSLFSSYSFFRRVPLFCVQRNSTISRALAAVIIARGKGKMTGHLELTKNACRRRREKERERERARQKKERKRCCASPFSTFKLCSSFPLPEEIPKNLNS